MQRANAKRVALQFPEGLLAYSCIISDILESYVHSNNLLLIFIFFYCLFLPPQAAHCLELSVFFISIWSISDDLVHL